MASTSRYYWLIAVLAAWLVPLPAAADEADVFSRLDKNKDGVLTGDEIDQPRQRLFKRLLRTSDKDKDGKLSRDEFVAGTKDQPPETDSPRPTSDRPGPQFNPAQLFNRIDQDGDGKIGKQELPERFRDLFAAGDANSDQGLDREEFAKMYAKLMQRIRQPGGDNPNARLAARRAEEMFQKVDANGDGKVTLAEIPQEQRERIKRFFQRIDTDGDGALTKAQFIRMAQSQAGGRTVTPTPRPASAAQRVQASRLFPAQAVLRALDTNTDGELSADEIAAASRTLKRLDKDGDGKISRRELAPQGTGAARPAADVAQQQFIRRILAADKNGDGKVSKEELPERLRQAFDRLDANDDGSLDEQELRRRFARPRPPQAGTDRRPQPRRRPRPEGETRDRKRPEKSDDQ